METRNLEKTAAAASSEEIQPLTLTRKTGKSCTYLYIKRMQDIVLSALALLLLSPLMLLLALAVVIDDPKGGPIFSQVRCGRGGEAFRLYKFRTMCVDAEKRLEELLPYNEMTGPAFKIQNDPRITRLGRFLRSTGLDELPQLVNILKGDMTIVGPRPPLFREVLEYTDYQRQRLAVTPGLTCFWQVAALPVSPNRNSLSFDAWVELDLRYIREQSWLLDWKLIFQTGRAVLRREGM